MTRPLTCAIAVALAVSTAARTGRAQGKPDPAFSPMEFLVGSCWIGTFPDGKQTDEHCFEWVYDRKYIRDRHVVRGGEPYQGETIYHVEPKTGTVAYWYISSAGLVVTGTVQATATGLVFPSKYATATGDVELRAVWVPGGGASYKVTNLQRAGDRWTELWTMEMRKQPR